MTARTPPVPRRRAPAPLRSATVEVVALVAVLVVLLLTVLPAAPALAHTRLVASTPAGGTAVPAQLPEVALSFTGEVRGELSTVVVTGPDGTAAAVDPVAVRGTDVVQAVRSPLTPGAWTVAYRVVASDGHPVTGTVEFSVADAPAGGPGTGSASTAVPQPSGAPSPAAQVRLAAASDDHGGSALAPAVAATALAVVVGAVVLRRRAVRSARD